MSKVTFAPNSTHKLWAINYGDHPVIKIKVKNIITKIDLDSGLASIDSLLSGSPSFSSNPSLSYHTLPLDEPLDPPLTPPQQQRQNQKNKQMIPCVEDSFWIDCHQIVCHQFETIFKNNVKSIHVNPVMSRRGYLLVLEQGSSHWTRRFVVVRRPYLLFYRSARDPVERSIINLSTAVVEYSADKQVRNWKLRIHWEKVV